MVDRLVAAMKSSQEAFDLIVREEDGSEALYTAKDTGFTWAGGASGPGVGIGYDLGYATHAQIDADWTGIVDAATLAKLHTAQGKTGSVARAFCRAHGHEVKITWAQAIKQFTERGMPAWEAKVAAALPNTDELSGDSFGALVSLAYNRGVGGFNLSDDRHREMHAIKVHMTGKNFDRIPGDFLAMRRLWPPHKDLWNRRTHEAALFQKGLTK